MNLQLKTTLKKFQENLQKKKNGPLLSTSGLFWGFLLKNKQGRKRLGENNRVSIMDRRTGNYKKKMVHTRFLCGLGLLNFHTRDS